MFFFGTLSSQLPVILLAILYVFGLANLYGGNNKAEKHSENSSSQHHQEYQSADSTDNSVNIFEAFSVDNDYAVCSENSNKVNITISSEWLFPDNNILQNHNSNKVRLFLRPPPYLV